MYSVLGTLSPLSSSYQIYETKNNIFQYQEPMTSLQRPVFCKMTVIHSLVYKFIKTNTNFIHFLNLDSYITDYFAQKCTHFLEGFVLRLCPSEKSYRLSPRVYPHTPLYKIFSRQNLCIQIAPLIEVIKPNLSAKKKIIMFYRSKMAAI